MIIAYFIYSASALDYADLRLSYEEAQEMFMVFNIVIKMTTTQRIYLLMDEDGKWRLSPAYDIDMRIIR